MKLRVEVDRLDLEVAGIGLVVVRQDASAAVGEQRVRLAGAGQARDGHPDGYRAARRSQVGQVSQVGVLVVGKYQVADENFGAGVSAQVAGMVDVAMGLAGEVTVSVVGKAQFDVSVRQLLHVPDRILRYLLEVEIPLPDPRAFQPGAYANRLLAMDLAQWSRYPYDPEAQPASHIGPEIPKPCRRRPGTRSGRIVQPGPPPPTPVPIATSDFIS